MSQREKAKELVDSFDFINIPNYTSIHEQKECAKMVVDGILNNIDSKYNGYYVMPRAAQKDFDYWEEVRIQIDLIK